MSEKIPMYTSVFVDYSVLGCVELRVCCNITGYVDNPNAEFAYSDVVEIDGVKLGIPAEIDDIFIEQANNGHGKKLTPLIEILELKALEIYNEGDE